MKAFTQKHLDLIQYINDLISIDLTDHASAARSRNRYLHIDTDNMNESQVSQLFQAAIKYQKFVIVSNGYKGLALILGDS